MEETLKKAKEDDIKFIELEFTDIFGTLKSIEIPVECLTDAIERGVWFDGSSIEGFARIMESDMYLKLDLSTYAVLPNGGEKKTARFICDIYTPDGKLFDGSPRTALKRVLEEAKSLGYKFMVGPEIEFYLFKKDEDGKMITPEFDSGSYFDSSAGDISSGIRKEIMIALKNFGITSERAHHEVAVGQHEIGFKYDDALTTADRVVTLKKVIKSIAHKHGLIASFMPKPMFGQNGSGMHVHFSLFDSEGTPLFFNADDKHKLSPLAKSFIAGELAYVKELSVLINPTVNSYKRLVAGYEAPVYISWGSNNRSALIRIPRYFKGNDASVRGELRCPDTSASPYLVFAAMLKAGLEGIKKNMELMPETEDSTYEEYDGLEVLPSSLGEAIELCKKSTLAKELLGDKLFEEYIKAKESEVEEFRIAVTEWEKERYLEKC